MAAERAQAADWATVYFNASTRSYRLARGVRDEVNGLAYGRFEDRLNQTGWSFLWVRTSSRFPDSQQMRAAGVLEGALTAPLLHHHYRNWYSRAFKDQLRPGDGAGGGASAELESLLLAQMQSLREGVAKAAKRRSGSDMAVSTRRDKAAYWQQLGLVLEQLDGLLEGHNLPEADGGSTSSDNRLTALPLLLLNAGSELGLLARSLRTEGELAADVPGTSQLLGSALLKLLPPAAAPDGRVRRQLLLAHASWQPYAHMLRVWKCLRTSLRHPATAAQSLSFPSHPGLLWSHDTLVCCQHRRRGRLGGGGAELATTGS